MKVSLSNTQVGIKVESLSKKAKHKTNRQAFFSRLMTKLAGDRGNTVSDLFANQKTDDFKSEMYKIVDEIAADADGAKPKVE